MQAAATKRPPGKYVDIMKHNGAVVWKACVCLLCDRAACWQLHESRMIEVEEWCRSDCETLCKVGEAGSNEGQLSGQIKATTHCDIHTLSCQLSLNFCLLLSHSRNSLFYVTVVRYALFFGGTVRGDENQGKSGVFSYDEILLKSTCRKSGEIGGFFLR